MNDNQDFAIDGITLDPDNKEFKYALDCVQYTNQLIYLTGKAGTGKTTFLKYLRKVTQKKMVVLAPTGVAAVNAKGQTIHSFFHIPPSLFVPDDKRLHEGFYDSFKYKDETVKIIRYLELLVIDEISMVRCDLLDVIDVILRRIRKKGLPFGGVQVLLIGDTFQLPPVFNQNDWSVLHKFYDSEFFFSSNVMKQVKPLYIELKKVYRQKDKEFVDVLNRIRVGKQDFSDISLLNSRVEQGVSLEDKDNFIILTTTNEAASSENRRMLDAIPSESSFFEADINEDFPSNIYPTEANLELKVGTQVMFIKNNWGKGYFNGKIGVVSEFKSGSIVVNVKNESGDISPIEVEPYTWGNIAYTWNDEEKVIEEKVLGTFKQYPLKLAWAITVHKSQGMTFEKVIADVGWSFAAGQVYVALSRCTSLNGLILKSRITPQAIRTDLRVIEFAKNEVPETLILEELQRGKADYYYAESRKCLKNGDAIGCYDNFIKAFKYRNDIETDLFKRIVSVWITRFYHNIAKNDRLINKIDSLESDNKALADTNTAQEIKISSLIDDLDILATERSKQKEKIKELNKESRKLKHTLSERDDVIEAKDKQIQTQNEYIKILQKEKDGLTSDNLSIKTKVELLEDTIKRLIDEKSNLEQELDRVRKIKWYQRLFGKK